MTKIYKFYLHQHEEDFVTFNADEISKDEMDFNVANHIYPQMPFCVREKWIDGEMMYSNVFLLEERRLDPDYISKFKRGLDQ